EPSVDATYEPSPSANAATPQSTSPSHPTNPASPPDKQAQQFKLSPFDQTQQHIFSKSMNPKSVILSHSARFNLFMVFEEDPFAKNPNPRSVINEQSCKLKTLIEFASVENNGSGWSEG
ncbi:unnamed protein product, partial [Prunus brigantina]